MQRPIAVLACLALVGCPKPTGGNGNPRRCEVDLKATGLFAFDGTGASAARIESSDQLIGGPTAQGRRGDVLLKNDKVRVVIEQPGRSVGPALSGGNIIDADLVRPDGAQGRDVFGRMALFYSLGRLSSVTDVEVIADGSSGGPAIVAASGKDVAHDLLNLKLLLNTVAGLPVEPVIDPSTPVNARLTTYFVLSPGESRVRLLSAVCNDSDETLRLPFIELMDVGAFELFNPGGCQNGIGASKLDDTNCLADSSKWVASQGEGVAYGLRHFSYRDLKAPVKANALIGYGGVVGALIEGEGLSGLLGWFDPKAERPGTFLLQPKATRSLLRDFVIGRDVADVAGTIWATQGTATGTAEFSGAPNARVSVTDTATGQMVSLAVTDASGQARAALPPGSYAATATRAGHTIGPRAAFTITEGQPTSVALTVGEGRALTVTVKDLSGAPSPGKVTVFCAPSPCRFDASTWKQHLFVEDLPMGAAAIGYVAMDGRLTLDLPPGAYDVVVSRGPEFSTWPDTWPARGHRVDLSTGPATVDAVVARIIDTPGWVSADLHVHASASSDSAVLNEVRVANFLAEGVDVLVSTDHEFITDYAPVVRALGAEQQLATMIGSEVTTFAYGHFNTFPLVRDPESPNGGAFDHAGGEDGPALRLSQLFPGIKAVHSGAVVQLNHPRGGSGVLSRLRVDTASLASHADPSGFGMEPAPDATANDTKLFSDTFDAVEVANGASPSTPVLNDWMTFLSRGTVRTATGVSDTHDVFADGPGYARTYVRVTKDTPTSFEPAELAEAIRTQAAYVTNGPVLSVTTRRLDAAMQPVGVPVGVGQTVSVAANESLELTVDVQGPEWMVLDRFELYSHAPGRESLDGQRNDSWPEGRVLERKAAPAMPTLEPVPGTSLRRLHVTERFVVRPTSDSWFVVMVKGQSRTMRPFHDTVPIAFSNAVLVDANGSGKYDDFPLKPGQPLRAATRPSPTRVPTATELSTAIRRLIEHRHDEP